MNTKFKSSTFYSIIVICIVILFGCTQKNDTNDDKYIENIDIENNVNDEFECEVEKEEVDTKEYYINTDKDTNKMCLFDKNNNLIYKSKWYELKIIYDINNGKPFMFLDVEYDSDGGFAESYDMKCNPLNISRSVEPLFVVNNYIVAQNGMYEKEIYKYVDNKNIDFLFKADDIDYVDENFFVSYGADYEDSIKMEIYDKNLILLKSYSQYIYLSKVLIGKKEFYKVGSYEFGYHRYNYIDRQFNLLLEYPYYGIEKIKAPLVTFLLDYGKIEYNYINNRISNEYIYNGYKKNNFIKYMNNSIYEIVTFRDGKAYCINDNNNFFILNEKMEQITHSLTYHISIENYWVRHKNDSIKNLIYSIYDGENYKYYATNNLFYTTNSNKTFAYCNNGYYFIRKDNGVVLKNINNKIVDTYIEWAVDANNEPIIDTYLIKIEDREYTLFDKYDNDNGFTKNESFAIYDEEFNKLDILINDSNYYIFNNYIAIYGNQNTKIYDKNFKLICKLDDRYYDVYNIETEGKTLYLFEKSSINGRWCDVYDASFNFVDSDVKIDGFVYKRIGFK